MYVLNKLWNGEISPMERSIRSGSEYHKALVEICEKTEALLEILPPEAKAQMEDLEDLRANLHLLAEADTFVYGFRLGAGMMLDIIGETEDPYSGTAGS